MAPKKPPAPTMRYLISLFIPSAAKDQRRQRDARARSDRTRIAVPPMIPCCARDKLEERLNNSNDPLLPRHEAIRPLLDCASRRHFPRRQGRVRLPDRRERRGEIDAAEADPPPDPGDRRADRGQRP